MGSEDSWGKSCCVGKVGSQTWIRQYDPGEWRDWSMAQDLDLSVRKNKELSEVYVTLSFIPVLWKGNIQY